MYLHRYIQRRSPNYFSLRQRIVFQVYSDVVDDGEKDQEARELAATRIQAITRGNRFRKNNTPEKGGADNNPRRHPLDNNGEREKPLENAGCSQYCASRALNGTASEGPGGAPSTDDRNSGDLAGGAPATSVGIVSAGGGGRGRGSVEIDRKTVTLIASLVDERIMVREQNSSPVGFSCS